MRQYGGEEEDLLLQYAIRQSLDNNTEQVRGRVKNHLLFAAVFFGPCSTVSQGLRTFKQLFFRQRLRPADMSAKSRVSLYAFLKKIFQFVKKIYIKNALLGLLESSLCCWVDGENIVVVASCINLSHQVVITIKSVLWAWKPTVLWQTWAV